MDHPSLHPLVVHYIPLTGNPLEVGVHVLQPHSASCERGERELCSCHPLAGATHPFLSKRIVYIECWNEILTHNITQDETTVRISTAAAAAAAAV